MLQSQHTLFLLVHIPPVYDLRNPCLVPRDCPLRGQLLRDPPLTFRIFLSNYNTSCITFINMA